MQRIILSHVNFLSHHYKVSTSWHCNDVIGNLHVTIWYAASWPHRRTNKRLDWQRGSVRHRSVTLWCDAPGHVYCCNATVNIWHLLTHKKIVMFYPLCKHVNGFSCDKETTPLCQLPTICCTTQVHTPWPRGSGHQESWYPDPLKSVICCDLFYCSACAFDMCLLN